MAYSLQARAWTMLAVGIFVGGASIWSMLVPGPSSTSAALMTVSAVLIVGASLLDALHEVARA